MSNSLIKYYDIFVPGGYPKYTYNPRETLELEEKVNSVLENLCKLVVVTGHTKSGKTVLVQKILPRESAAWIDGGGITTEDDFWSTLLDQLDLFQTTTETRADTVSGSVNSEANASGGIVVAKAGVKLGAKFEGTKSEAQAQTRIVSSRSAALVGLRNLRTPLVIDDFHYLPKELQGNIVRALKPLIFDGIPVVVIAIPHRRYDAIKVEKEMTGRILSLTVPRWSSDELGFIPSTGFSLLNKNVSNEVFIKLANESIGSPHLMQEFCREICKTRLNIDQSLASLKATNLDEILIETAETTIGRPIFEKLARGPRQRSDRIQRTLKSGEKVDIYGLVLAGLAHIKPELITLEYEDLRTAIREICMPENVPNVQEVARVLKHMAEISATDESSTPVIDFDEEEKVLHITDPFFAFYLRWGRIFS